MVHRYFAGLLGLMITVLAARAWMNRRHPGLPLKLPLFLLAVVFAQAAFGMWTVTRSEEHTSELQSLMRISYAVFCLKKKNNKRQINSVHKQSRKLNQHKQ